MESRQREFWGRGDENEQLQNSRVGLPTAMKKAGERGTAIDKIPRSRFGLPNVIKKAVTLRVTNIHTMAVDALPKIERSW